MSVISYTIKAPILKRRIRRTKKAETYLEHPCSRRYSSSGAALGQRCPRWKAYIIWSWSNSQDHLLAHCSLNTKHPALISIYRRTSLSKISPSSKSSPPLLLIQESYGSDQLSILNYLPSPRTTILKAPDTDSMLIYCENI